MPLANFDEYTAKLRENSAAHFVTTAGSRLRLFAGWTNFVPVPATPTTSIALDRTGDFALRDIPAAGAGRPSILGARLNPGGIGGVALIVVDLLNLSGGLTMNSASTQTTNLPTAALTRYTSGEGVMAGIVAQQQLASAATTFTVSYTNQSGTSGRTSPVSQIAGTGWRENGAIMPIPLQAGDTGIRSIESVTIAAASGGAQLFGVCLFKPLAMFALNDFSGAHALDAISSGGFLGALAEYHPDACLSVMMMNSLSAGQPVSGSIILGEV